MSIKSSPEPEYSENPLLPAWSDLLEKASMFKGLLENKSKKALRELLKHRFLEAIEHSNWGEMVACLQEGVLVDTKLPSGLTPLGFFVQEGNAEGIRKLSPFSPSIKQEGWYLSMALEQMRMDVVDALVDLGVKDHAEVVDSEGNLSESDPFLYGLPHRLPQDKSVGNFILQWLDRHNLHTASDLQKRLHKPDADYFLRKMIIRATLEKNTKLFNRMVGMNSVENESPVKKARERQKVWELFFNFECVNAPERVRESIEYLMQNDYAPSLVVPFQGEKLSVFWLTLGTSPQLKSLGGEEKAPCALWFLQNKEIREKVKKDIQAASSVVFSFCCWAPEEVLKELNTINSLDLLRDSKNNNLAHFWAEGRDITRRQVNFLLRERLGHWLEEKNNSGETPFEILSSMEEADQCGNPSSGGSGAEDLKRYYERRILRNKVSEMENDGLRLKKSVHHRL